MLRTNEPWQRYEKIVFVHGVRHKNDLAYQSELAAYRDRYGKRFASVAVVSREDVPGALSGRITTCWPTVRWKTWPSKRYRLMHAS